MRDNFFYFMIFLCIFSMYVVTCAPDVQFGDNAEFATSSWNLGICHNPGYPVQSLLGHFSSRFLPLGSIAFRVNLVSCVLTALSAVMISIFLRYIQQPFSVIVPAVMFFASGPMVWQQATLAEVYPADSFFVLIYLLVFQQVKKDTTRNLLLIFFMVLGLSIHLTHVLYLPVFLYFVVRSSQLKFSYWMSMTLLAIFACGIWIYEPLRSAAGAIPNSGTPATLSFLLEHVSGSMHRRHAVMNLSFADSMKRFPEYFRLCIIPSIPAAAFLALIPGIAAIWKYHRKLLYVFLWILMANASYAVFLNQVPFEATPFGIPVAALLSIICGIGIGGVLLLIQRYSSILAFLSIASVILMSVIFPLAQVARYSRSEDWEPHRFGRLQMDVLPDDSALMVKGDDEVFIGMYAHEIEKRRPDIRWVDVTGATGSGPMPLAVRFPSQESFFRAFQLLERKLAEQTGGKLFYSWRYSWEYHPLGITTTNWQIPTPIKDFSNRVVPAIFPLPDDAANKDLQFRRKIAQIRIMQALDLILNQDAGGALVEIRRALKYGEGIAEVYIDAAELLMYMNHYEEAVVLLKQAAELKPSAEAVYLLLSQAFKAQNKQDESQLAEARYRELLRRYFK